MGRPAKSEREHFVNGTKSTAKSADQSHVPAGRPKFPRAADASLRPIFKRLCALLAERRALTKGDCELLRLYCFLHDRHSRNVGLLRGEGELVTYFRLDSNGVSVPQVKTNLRLAVVSNAEKQMVAILTALGLSPTAKDRAKPVRPEAPTENEVIPGTMGWFAREEKQKKESVPFVLPPSEMLASEEEPEEGETDA